MPRRSSTTKRRGGTERLGPVLHRLRTERSITASKMSRDTGLSPSYLNYLEHGRFGDVGIEKFARLVQAMKVSADQVLTEAGYLPKRSKGKPLDPHSYLRDHYKLSPANLELATKFLEMLARTQRRGMQAEKEPRRK